MESIGSNPTVLTSRGIFIGRMFSLADTVNQCIACLNVYVAQLNCMQFYFVFLYLIEISLGKLSCVLILYLIFDLLIGHLCIRVLILFHKTKISTSIFFSSYD